jgi:uncharacterized membrane protein
MDKEKLDIPLSRYENMIQVLALFVIIYISFLMINNYGSVPDQIPTHYNTMGEADAWGRKTSLITLYIVNLVMYIGLTLLERYPEIYNYPVAITEENRKRQYFMARSFLTTLKLSTVVIFLVMIASGFRVGANEHRLIMGSYFIFFMLGTIFIPIIIYIVLAIRNK